MVEFQQVKDSADAVVHEIKLEIDAAAEPSSTAQGSAEMDAEMAGALGAACRAHGVRAAFPLLDAGVFRAAGVNTAPVATRLIYTASQALALRPSKKKIPLKKNVSQKYHCLIQKIWIKMP